MIITKKFINLLLLFKVSKMNIISFDLFKVSRMTIEIFDMFKVRKMTTKNFYLFEDDKMTNVKSSHTRSNLLKSKVFKKQQTKIYDYSTYTQKPL